MASFKVSVAQIMAAINVAKKIRAWWKARKERKTPDVPDKVEPPVVVPPTPPAFEYCKVLLELPDDSLLADGDAIWCAVLGEAYFVIPKGIGVKPPSGYVLFKIVEKD